MMIKLLLELSRKVLFLQKEFYAKVLMSDLRKVREGWLAVYREETQMLRSLTINESINQWLMLQHAFNWQLQQTAYLFETQRREAMIEFQVRLGSLVNLQGGCD